MKKQFPKFLLLLFFLLLIPLLVFLARKTIEYRSRAAGENARLEFSTTTSPITLESPNFNVPILLNTDGVNVVGVDFNITFDKTKLELTDITKNAAATTNFKTYLPVISAQNNNNFDLTRVKTAANTNGIIDFGVTTVASTADGSGNLTWSSLPAFNGSTIIAGLTFRALAVGDTTVNINCTAGNMNDSNIAKELPVDSQTAIDIFNCSYAGLKKTLTVQVTSCAGGNLGDIDCDGLRNETDGSLILLNWRTSLLTPVPEFKPGQKRSADVTGDGLIDEADFSRLLLNWKTQ